MPLTGPVRTAVTRADLGERVRALRAWIVALAGWRRAALAGGAGVASVLAMAPFHAFPILWVTFPILVWLLETPEPPSAPAGTWARVWRHGAMRAALTAWWFAFGYFFAGLFWVGEAFLVEAEKFAVLLPLAVTALPAGLALFWAAAAGLARLAPSDGFSRVLALGVTLPAAEYLRGHVLTGFPWNVPGYALTWPLPLLQSAAYGGIYLLTVVAVLIFALPLVLVAEAAAGPRGRRPRRVALAVAVLPLTALALLGAWRLSAASPPHVPGVRIRVVQPSVPQREKWRPENQERIFADHLALSGTGPDGRPDGLAGITHVVWPEAAMPFFPLHYPQVKAAIGRMLPERALLVAGALRAETAPDRPLRPHRIFNSILVFGHDGEAHATYDKIHLVPFGEYLPLQGALEAIGLEQLTRLRGGFDSGIRPRPLLALGAMPPAVPLVCYEAIFPAAVVQGPERPGLILNLTNDGWFGNSTGPRQHVHQTRVRAVEEGLPLIRAANNGISAAFDPYGRLLARLDLDVRGTFDVALPESLPAPPYARFRDLPFLATELLLAGLMLWRTTRLPRHGRTLG